MFLIGDLLYDFIILLKHEWVKYAFVN